MENATRRIRKARRQGLTTSKDVGRSSRLQTGGPQRLADRDQTPRPHRVRKTKVTGRKGKRQRKAAPTAR